MTDTVVSDSSPVAVLSANKKKTAVATKKAAPAHPSTAIMVTCAIKDLKERKGSSLPAIKKYLATNYQVDPTKLAPFIRRFLKASAINGTVVQTKGHFKLAVIEVKPKKSVTTKKPIAKKLKPVTANGTPKKKKKPSSKKSKSVPSEPAAKKIKKTAVAESKKTKLTKIVVAPAIKSKTPKKTTTKVVKKK